MVGAQLTGELDWEEVAKLAGSGSFVLSASSQSGRIFYVRTKDGASIAVSDVYDAPLSFIREVCETFARRRG